MISTAIPNIKIDTTTAFTTTRKKIEDRKTGSKFKH